MRSECGIGLSPSDPRRLAGCAHAMTPGSARTMGGGPAPGEDSEDAAPMQRPGVALAARRPARLRGRGPRRRRNIRGLVAASTGRGGDPCRAEGIAGQGDDWSVLECVAWRCP